MTSIRSDYEIHDEAADNALSDAMHAGNSFDQQKFLSIASVEATRAQAAVTRELVEAQHTANLIAIFDEQGPEVFRAPDMKRSDFPDSFAMGKARGEAANAVRAQYLAVADDVARRLGLA